MLSGLEAALAKTRATKGKGHYLLCHLSYTNSQGFRKSTTTAHH